MIEIKTIKKTNGQGIVKKFKETYGSIERLKKFAKENPDSMRAHFDLEDWRYYQVHLNEEIELTESIIGQNINIGQIELNILDSIKNQKPKSVRELSKFLNKDPTTIQRKVNILEKMDLISLKEGIKNSKIPVVNYDKIEISL
jgi:lipopolysaccharide biosynthesis regulator YciM